MIPVTGITSLPSKAEKDNVVGTSSAKLPPRWSKAAVPWNMAEVLPEEFWEAFIQHLSVSTIIDLTPGPTLARACLASSVTYHALCKSKAFEQWLLSIVDTAALKPTGRGIVFFVLRAVWLLRSAAVLEPLLSFCSASKVCDGPGKDPVL